MSTVTCNGFLFYSCVICTCIVASQLSVISVGNYIHLQIVVAQNQTTKQIVATASEEYIQSYKNWLIDTYIAHNLMHAVRSPLFYHTSTLTMGVTYSYSSHLLLCALVLYNDLTQHSCTDGHLHQLHLP